MVHPPTVSIVTFGSEHVLPAAGLVAIGVERLRAQVPALPATWVDPALVARVISGLVERGAGLAVIDDGRLVAFQAAILIDGHGGRWSYTPDVGHAAPWDEGGRLRETLYTGLAGEWIRGASPEHVVTVLADDAPASTTFAHLGFGHFVVDLVRDLSPVPTPTLPEGISLRRAVPEDARSVADLDGALRRHLQASPIFLRLGAAQALEVHRRQIGDPSEATFLALRDGEAVASLRIGPCAADVATIVRDAGTASVTAAYTVLGLRGGGVATCLLAAAVDWARAAGYVRCAVDHESANREAARFWSRHFTPVAVSMSRRLAPGIVL
jgi:GNAT superfamily N-acetyltransferase